MKNETQNNETILSIAKWHEETFPEATLTNQLEKFTEETREWSASDNQDISELADMFIVACGISRFSLTLAALKFNKVAHYLVSENVDPREFDKTVRKKMEKNRQRKWAKVKTGGYHHE